MRAILIIVLFLYSTVLLSQDIEFKYDNAGNRILRDIRVYQLANQSDFTNDMQSETQFKSSDAGKDKSEKTETDLAVTDIKVYPNPVQEKIIVNMPANMLGSNCVMLVHNLQGQEVYQQAIVSEENEIDFLSRPAGVYILTIVYGDSKKSFKVVKEN